MSDCPQCGEGFHGRASCLATLKHEIAKVRAENRELRAKVPAHTEELPSLLTKTMSQNAEVPFDKSAHMRQVWAKRKALKSN